MIGRMGARHNPPRAICALSVSRPLEARRPVDARGHGICPAATSLAPVRYTRAMTDLALSPPLPRPSRLAVALSCTVLTAFAGDIMIADGGVPHRLAPESRGGAVVDVEAEMTRVGAYEPGSDGIRSFQVPEDDAAHAFRAAPADRRGLYDPNNGLSYFLEDPWAPFPGPGGALRVDLRGPDGAASSTYLVNGDLFVDSHRALAFHVVTGRAAPTLILVRGNIHIADDIDADGPLELRAVRRADGTGGDIFLGDPRFGTLSRVDVLLAADGRIVHGPQ